MITYDTAQHPLKPEDCTPVLQKDLVIRRMAGYSHYKYQYVLFKDDKSVCNHSSDAEYPLGLVCIHPSDGSIRLTMKQICELDFQTVEDDDVFVVPVTIKN